MRQLSQSTRLSAEVRRYLQDIVVFLRLERGVAGGVSPSATSQFELLTKLVVKAFGCCKMADFQQVFGNSSWIGVCYAFLGCSGSKEDLSA